jgi:hypothetical protein
MGALTKSTLNQARTLLTREYEGGEIHWLFWCPACKETHFFSKRMPDGKPGWEFDGNIEKPTFSPSLRYLTGKKCHLNLTSGTIHFHGDCPHDMKNQKADLTPIPDSEFYDSEKSLLEVPK